MQKTQIFKVLLHVCDFLSVAPWTLQVYPCHNSPCHLFILTTSFHLKFGYLNVLPDYIIKCTIFISL